MTVSKLQVAVESAVRVFIWAALPALGTTLVQNNGAPLKSAAEAAVIAALAAGLAAVGRMVKPLKVDAAGVGVEGVPPVKPPGPA